MKEYEKVLEDIRPFGPFQIRVFLLVSMFETPLAWAMLLPMFTSAKPEKICSMHATNNTTASDKDECWGEEANGKEHHCSDSFTSIVTEWGLHCPNNRDIADHITSMQMAGVLVGAVVTGQLADLFGRKKVLYAEYLLLLIMWFGSAFAPTWQVYATMRVLVGALTGGCLVVNFVLPLEFVTPAWRTFCGCIGLWAVGLITLAGWAYVLRDWRHLTMATAAAGVPMLFTWWFVAESPRWLISRGRLGKAKKILKLAARTNGRPVPDFSELERIAEEEQHKKQEQKNYFYWHLFSSCKLVRGSLILMYAWFVSSAVYYGMNFNVANLAGDRYLNALVSGLVEIPALILVVCINNRWGRRKTVAFLMLVAGLFSFSILIIHVTDNMEKQKALVVTFAMIGKFGISGGWAATQVFSAETFPTVIRNIGIGACSMAARIGGIVAPQLVLLGKDNKAVPFAVFGVLAMLCAFLMSFLPETTHSPLSDLLKYDTSVCLTEQTIDVPLTLTQSGNSEQVGEISPSEELQPLAGSETGHGAGDASMQNGVA